MTLRSQAVSRAPIAQQHRETQPVAVQDRPISTSFPSLGRPVNHPEAEYTPQFCDIHLRVALRQIDLVLIFSMRALRRQPFYLSYSVKNERVSLFAHLYSARKGERTSVLPAARKFEHRFNVVSTQLAGARFYVRDDAAHHPLAQRPCPLRIFLVLR